MFPVSRKETSNIKESLLYLWKEVNTFQENSVFSKTDSDFLIVT